MILESIQEQICRNFGDRFSYEAAESGEEALEILEELDEEGVQVVLIVSDWLMPEMRGDEFLIQAHQKFDGIIKIMLTGQADEAAIERATREADLYCCIYKPWREEELIATIKSGLDII